MGRRLQATLITGVGVAVLTGIAPRVATTVVTLAMFSRVEPIAGTVTDTLRWPALLELGVTLGIGLYLCLGARGLSNAIRTLRGDARPRGADGDAHSLD
jgi:formate hydrogenlyase subunit 3/multisubunit Na+/H+ antiporter MnhD subunit